MAPIPIESEKKACPIALITTSGVMLEKSGLKRKKIVSLKLPIYEE